MIGFVAGLMYLIQARRLKLKRPPSERIRLPSLERLAKVNSRSLVLSALLVGIGVVAGIILNVISRGQSGEVPWNDPVIGSSALMLVWLVVAAAFNAAYQPVRRGPQGRLPHDRQLRVLADRVGRFPAGGYAARQCSCAARTTGRHNRPQRGREADHEAANDRLQPSPLVAGGARARGVHARGVGAGACAVALAISGGRERCCYPPAIAWKFTPPPTMTRPAPATRRSRSSWPIFTGCRFTRSSTICFERTGEDAVRHLFTVAASLDSMVVGEPQILAQVKQAYELAKQRKCAGPLTHGIFQAAVRVAKRVATRNQDQPAPREHSQRGRGRLRTRHLRTIRRQENAGHRRRRDGRGNAALPAGRRGAPT